MTFQQAAIPREAGAVRPEVTSPAAGKGPPLAWPGRDGRAIHWMI